MKTLAFILCALLFFSCKKNSTGGEASVSFTVMHHSWVIPKATVYIKYGATTKPGSLNPSDFDDHVQADSSGQAEFKNLRYGNYYLYATGYDKYYLGNVSGGCYVNIKWSQRKKDLTYTVSVSE
ncbi:MAG TPA: hypothetical protein VNZ49_11230 [Bacteroidia bacterium]|nr:hypothetical protein [Bacteroidia bacterium]